MAKPRTLYDKIWDEHLVHEAPDGTCLILSITRDSMRSAVSLT